MGRVASLSKPFWNIHLSSSQDPAHHPLSFYDCEKMTLGSSLPGRPSKTGKGKQTCSVWDFIYEILNTQKGQKHVCWEDGKGGCFCLLEEGLSCSHQKKWCLEKKGILQQWILGTLGAKDSTQKARTLGTGTWQQALGYLQLGNLAHAGDLLG